MRGCRRGPFDQDKYLELIVSLEAQIQRNFESSTFRHCNFCVVLVPFDKISDVLYVAIIEDRCCLLEDLLTLVDCSARLELWFTRGQVCNLHATARYGLYPSGFSISASGIVTGYLILTPEVSAFRTAAS